MKNILLLTSVYPSDDLPNDITPVVHYFAREWVNMGYNVIVVHNLKYYPKILHLLFQLFKSFISKNYDYPFPLIQNHKDKTYIIDNVHVYRLPVYKWMPKLLISRKSLSKQYSRIIKVLDSTNFVPDVIIGHWPEPQLYLVANLKKKYNSKTCMVMHNDVNIVRKIYGNKTAEFTDAIDIWGFRSNTIKQKFKGLYNLPKKSFFCYSGIPKQPSKPPSKTFENGIKKFLFVGLLIPRKNPTTLIKAINMTFADTDFHITFIGTGPERQKLIKLSKKLGITNKISLKGRISREEVFKEMKNADCFIMVSKPETLGLVYIEAMSMGCITIGSRNEGVDGIISHGKNGFLSNPGNHNELSELLKYISTLSKQELIKISKSAIKTASELTDKKAAKHYIESVLL